MILVISPAKAQDFSTPAPAADCSQPGFLKEAAQLMKRLRALGLDELTCLMGISPDLAALNAGRFAQWKPPFTPGNAKQAAFAFDGDAYGGLDAASLGPAGLAFAQDHLRILSGLYGLLRPLDLIQPYRLEMRIPLANARGRDLYAFWGDRLTRAVNLLLRAGPGEPVLVNLASGEYFKALDGRALAGRIVTPVFQDLKPGGYKVISFHAKRARGLMARYAIRKRAEDPEVLKRFREEGYAFDRKASEADRWVFRRG